MKLFDCYLKTRENMVKRKATLESVIACFEEGWWWSGFDGKRKGWLWALACLNVPSGNVSWLCCQVVDFSFETLIFPTLFLMCLLLEVKLRPPNLPQWIEVLFLNQFHLRQFLWKDILKSNELSLNNSLAVNNGKLGGTVAPQGNFFDVTKQQI